jgi:hypothetical protein
MTTEERRRAADLSAAIDQMMLAPDAQPVQASNADADLLDTAQRLAHLPALLGPVDPALEGRVMGIVRSGLEPRRPKRRYRLGWAVAGLAIILLLATWLTPIGQTSLASFLSVFNLGRTQVRITPVNTPAAPLATGVAQSTAVQRPMTMEEAQARFGFDIPEPSYVPQGYRLLSVSSYSYPDLPAWIQQPFFIELVYGHDSGDVCKLRIYPITLGDKASISGLDLQAAPIHTVQDVDVRDQPGVLLSLGTDRVQSVWQEVVWEQADLILALSTTDLSAEELLRVARSVR